MFADLPRPLLFAHRGASLEAPENTLEAFERAVELGADVLELDVHVSADGDVVVFHDETLGRTTNARGPLAARTLAELEVLDAGFCFRDRRGAWTYRERGVRIPTLAAVFEAFPRAAFNIELKANDSRLLPAVLERLRAASIGPEQVVLTAGRPAVMKILEAAGTSYPLGLSRESILDVLRHVWTGRGVPERYRGRALQIPPRSGVLPVATGPVIRAAHRADVEVHLWTINDATRAKRWLAKGVDGIMSDDPGALAPLFAARRGAEASRAG